jgi:hypothetical protein
MRNDAASLEKGRTPDELLELVKNGTDKSILLQAASSIDMTDALFSGSGRNKRQRLHRPNDSNEEGLSLKICGSSGSRNIYVAPAYFKSYQAAPPFYKVIFNANTPLLPEGNADASSRIFFTSCSPPWESGMPKMCR